MSMFKYSAAVILPAILIASFTFFLQTEIPDGVSEKWSARMIDATLRINEKIIFAAAVLGLPGGVTSFTRGMVSTSLKLMMTGSPFGLGSDPELKIYDTSFGGVHVRVYEPVALDQEKKRPVMVYYHGGGWTWMDTDVYDPITRRLAKMVPMVVVSVSYRLSPEHAHPIPLEDCLAVAKYVINHASDLHIDPKRVAISGDSAGGHLTTAVTSKLKSKVKMQIPIYPCLQLFDMQTPSYIENKDYIPGMLNHFSMLIYWMNHGNISYDYINQFLSNEHTSVDLKNSVYAERVDPKWYMPEHIRTASLKNMKKSKDFGDNEVSKKYEKTIIDPLFAPLMASDEEYKNLPLTYVLTAGYDVLRDDGIMYAQRLKKAGVEVHHAHYPEGFHGMISFADGPISFEVGNRSIEDLVGFLQQRL